MLLNLVSMILSINTAGCLNNQCNNYILNNEEISNKCRISVEEMGLENLCDNQNVVKDLNGNIFVVQESADGFAIYDSISDETLECVKTSMSPYLFDSVHDNYYFGPMQYYYRIENNFFHWVENDFVIDIEEAKCLQQNFNKQLDTFRSSISNAKSNLSPSRPLKVHQTVGDKTYISNYKYVRDCVYPKNFDGSCGFVAGSIILNYWDKTVHDGVVASCFKDPITGELNNTGSTFDDTKNLKDKLVKYNNLNTDSTGRTVANAINKYCSDYGVDGSASWYLGKIGLDESLANDRPAIILGAIPDLKDGGLCFHAVTCYGVDNRWWGGYYIVNYGWTGYSEVDLGFGFAGETMTFSLNENSYKSTYTIAPTDYGFPCSYNATSISKVVNIGSLSFETNRLRCGFIENEYINISPRKEGFDTAYLEFKFKNPINSISIDMSFWSNDERYYGLNRAEAYLQYKDLYCTNWQNKTDLLNDVSLPTNRKKQKTINLFFPLKTREFRIYSHFDYMYGIADRNKGRISIGNIVLDSYH